MTKRLAQELVVNDKVAFLAGFGLTPGALATAPIATEAKIPQVVMMAATSVITERSPYIVRTSFSVPQTTVPLANWAAANGIKTVVTVVSDYAPGIDVETAFKQRFEAAGGKVIESLRVPLASPDFAPALQRVADAKPDALMGFVPAGVGPIFMRQFVERGLDKSGIKFIAEGSLTEDDIVNQIGDAALGVITSHHYSAAHDSPENKAFVAEFKKANGGMRPNLMAMQSYDGMHLIYEALKKTNGSTDGDRACRRDEGLELDQSARTGDRRSRDARNDTEHLHPQSRARERRVVQCRVCDHSQLQGSVQAEELARLQRPGGPRRLLGEDR